MCSHIPHSGFFFFHAESGAFTAWLLEQKATDCLSGSKSGKHTREIGRGVMDCDMESQDPAPLSEAAMTRSKDARADLPLLKNIHRHSDSHQSLQLGCKLPTFVWKQATFSNTVIINLLDPIALAVYSLTLKCMSFNVEWFPLFLLLWAVCLWTDLNPSTASSKHSPLHLFLLLTSCLFSLHLKFPLWPSNLSILLHISDCPF